MGSLTSRCHSTTCRSHASRCYSLADTAANLAAAPALVGDGASSITVTDAATVAQATAIDAFLNTGVNSYVLTDTAAALAGATTSVGHGATNIIATTAATVAQATAIDAFTNSGSNSFSLSDTAANLAAALASVANQATNISATDARYGLAGKDLECWAEGTYNWSEYNNPEYMNIPFYYGIQPVNGVVPSFVYGLFFDNPCRSLFSFGGPAANNDATKSTFQAGDGQMDYFFFGGGTNHTMASVVDRYSQLTGRPTMLPKWAMGHHLSRFSYWCQSWVQSLADAATSSNMPLDAVYLDIDYMDTDDNPNAFGPLQQLWLNPNADGNGAMCNHFPNSPAMVSYCGAKGVKIVPLIEPWLEPSDSVNIRVTYNTNYRGSSLKGIHTFLPGKGFNLRTFIIK